MKNTIKTRKIHIAYAVCLMCTDQIGFVRYLYENYGNGFKQKFKETFNGRTHSDNIENYEIGVKVD
jgi:hypothetical protein